MTLQEPPADSFAATLRRFRAARHMSQMDLALECEVSTRHLSFLETGRAQPSREMVLQLADGLTLPRPARNGLLQAAGFAALYPTSPLDSEVLGPFREILAEMMARHAPNPALLCDRHWNVLQTNPSADALLGALGDGAGGANIVRMLTDNPRIGEVIVNLPEVLAEMAGRLRLEALEAGEDHALRDHVRALDLALARLPGGGRAVAMRRPLVPLVINGPSGHLSFFSTIAQFGTSEDVTVRDLRLELLFPMDDETRRAMATFAPEAAIS